VLLVSEIIKVIRAEPTGKIIDEMIKGVSVDSRRIKKGEVFFGIKGERYDGNLFAHEALDKGAILSVVNTGKVRGDKIVHVEDTIEALGKLASYYRNKLNAKIIGITGTNGKTTTKRILEKILSTHFKTIASFKSYNNMIGVPLTILSMKKDTEVGIVEIGINQIGEMEKLAGIVRPHIALITNIGPGHLEGLKNEKTVAQEKMKIADYLKENIIFLPADSRLLKDAEKRKVKVVSFGESKRADYCIRIKKMEKEGSYFSINDEDFFINLPGRGNVFNAGGAGVLAMHYFNIPSYEIKKLFKNLNGEKMRLEIKKVKKITIINDAYNANPVSVKNSIEYLGMFEGRKIAVLGPMLELGTREKKYHEEVIDYAKKRVDILIVYDEKDLYPKNRGFKKFKNSQEIIDYLKEILKDGDTILFKASRKFEFEKIIKMLEEAYALSPSLSTS